MAMIRESGEMLDDPEVELYLNQLGRRLSSASPEWGKFSVLPMLDPQINAFVPARRLYRRAHRADLHRAKRILELASVIGHEMAHVAQRHIARSMAQQGQ